MLRLTFHVSAEHMSWIKLQRIWGWCICELIHKICQYFWQWPRRDLVKGFGYPSSQKIILYNMEVKWKYKIHICSVYGLFFIYLVHVSVKSKVDVSTHRKKNMLKPRIYLLHSWIVENPRWSLPVSSTPEMNETLCMISQSTFIISLQKLARELSSILCGIAYN